MLTIGVGELLMFVMTRDPVTVTVVRVVFSGPEFVRLLSALAEFDRGALGCVASAGVDCGWAASGWAKAAGAGKNPMPIALIESNNITRLRFIISFPLCW
ncbi:MAG: hypothetical protein WAU49_18065 [Steroidobacteraceae bacterium]